MSFKKVAFLKSFTTDKPDPQPEKPSAYQRKNKLKTPSASWMFVSTMTCRDFSKDSYNYRDKNFILSDEGITYELPSHLKAVYEKKDKFSKTEFRKLPLNPGKLRNENKKQFPQMSYSNFQVITDTNRI